MFKLDTVAVVATISLCLAFPGLARAQMPPEKYDKPYDGHLIEHVVPYGKAWETCNRVSIEAGGDPWPKKYQRIMGRHLYGCSMDAEIDGQKACIIVYSWSAKDPKMRPNVFRHERAHCNGWGSNHPT
jgi:hypothetical protein